MTALPGFILAGGRSRRMGGGDKCLLPVDGATLLERVIERLRPQVTTLALNANGPPERFADFAVPVVADRVPGQLGPLAGVLTGLCWARDQGLDWCLSVAADTPLFPEDLAARLCATVANGTKVAIAASGERVHPVFALWSVDLIGPAGDALRAERLGLWKFAQAHGAVSVDWPDQPFDPFFNANTPEDVERLTELLRRR